MKTKSSLAEKVFDSLNYVFLFIIILITIYPFYYVFCASISSSYQLMAHQGLLLWPQGFNIEGYILVLQNRNVTTGYINTLFYVIVGTTLNIFLTLLAAYVLSRKWMYGKNVFMLLITFTMFFHGGLIPSYLLVKSLGLIDTRWALILPNAILVWNIIIMRTYFNGIPESMEESARIDGANDFIILFLIMLPLALPTVAVNILFYAVGHWNSWFNALIYLKSKELYPLQMFLREILVIGNMQDMTNVASEPIADNIKYATIIIATVPILMVYPFLQKYFVKGVMVGAIKG